MPWERTLLMNDVGEPDAPTKSTSAYLSDASGNLLYATPSLPQTVRFFLEPFSSQMMLLRADFTGLRDRLQVLMSFMIISLPVSIGLGQG
ncbi:hypothetical protein Pan110_47530 [Gimesia panareensis]|nr:hypothetical protein Pan110_47530 [Gimesia panareensis]